MCSNHSLPLPDFCNSSTGAPSVSSQPSISHVPSLSPSVSSSNEPSVSSAPSSMPSISQAPSNFIPPQSTYFQMIVKTSSEIKYCIEAGYPTKLQECSADKHKQLWKADYNGQIRSYHYENQCLTPVKRNKKTNENLKLYPCEGESESMRGVLMFNGFQNSILWMVSNVDWQNQGMKAISVKNINSNALVTVEWHFYGDFSNKFAQQWEIIYPNVKL